MPIRLPTLDDRTYDDLVRELRGLIPTYAPEWTDHNPSDPGITLLELFAWLAEGLMYRIDQVPDASSERMLRLLGADFRPAQPANVLLRVSLADAQTGEVIVPAGAVVEAQPSGRETRVTFETVAAVRLTRDWPEALVTARQVSRVAGEFLGRGTGAPRQSFPLAARQVFVDAGGGAQRGPLTNGTPTPCEVQVTVDGQPWHYRTKLDGLGQDQKCFTVDFRRNVVRFGPGKPNLPRRWPPRGIASEGAPPQGASTQRAPAQKAAAQAEASEPANVVRDEGEAPPLRSALVASYCYTLGAAGNTSDESRYTLQRPLPGVSLEPVGPATGGMDATTLADARGQVYDTINSPWRAITSQDFEDLIRGPAKFGIARAMSLPEVDARGPGTSDTRAGGSSDKDSSEAAGEVRAEPGHVSVMVLPEPASSALTDPASSPLVEMVAPARNGPMTVHQTVFSADGDALAVWAVASANRPARDCIWAWRLTASRDEPAASWGENAYRPPATPLPLPVDSRVTSLSLSPDGRWLTHGLSRTPRRLSPSPGRPAADNWVVLWDLERLVFSEPTKPGERERCFAAPASAIVFRPDSRQFVIVAGNLARRHNAPGGAFAGDLPHPARVLSAAYSPDGRLLATVAEDNAVRVWGAAWSSLAADVGAGEAELLAVYPHAAAIRTLLFTPDSRRLVTLSGPNTLLAWPAPRPSGAPGPRDLSVEPVALADVPFAEVAGIALRQRGRRLAAAGHDGQGRHGVALFELATGVRESGEWELPRGTLLTALSPDLHRLLFVDDDDRLHAQVWDSDERVRMGVLHHDEPVRSALFSPDSQHLITIAAPADEAPAPTAGGMAALAPAPDGAEVHVARAWNTTGAGLELSVYLTRPASLGRGNADGADAPTPTAEVGGALGPEGKLLATWWVRPAGAPADGGKLPPVVQVWEAEKLGRASAFLDGRRLVTTHHHVLGSRFVDVLVRGAVVPVGQVDALKLRKDIHAALDRFFAPLVAGPLRAPLVDSAASAGDEGWPYGRNIHISEVYEAIEAVPGVDHVASLTLLGRAAPSSGGEAGSAKLPGWQDAGPEIFVLPNQLVHYVGAPPTAEPQPGDPAPDIVIRRPGS